MFTATTLSKIFGASFQAAGTALDELHQVAVVQTTSIERSATAYIAREVLDVITSTERALVNTKFDTRASVTNRPVPAPPRQE